MNNEDNIALEQGLAKKIQQIYKTLWELDSPVIPLCVIFSVLAEEVNEIIAQYPEANIEKLKILLNGDGEYSIRYIIGDSDSIEIESNSEDEEDLAVLGENANEQADC